MFLLRSVTCGISRVIGLLLGILVGPSGPSWDVFGTYSAALAPHVTVAAPGQGTVYLQPPRGRPGPGKCVFAFPPSWARRPRFWFGKVGAPSRWRAFAFLKYTDCGVICVHRLCLQLCICVRGSTVYTDCGVICVHRSCSHLCIWSVLLAGGGDWAGTFAFLSAGPGGGVLRRRNTQFVCPTVHVCSALFAGVVTGWEFPRISRLAQEGAMVWEGRRHGGLG